MADPIIEIQIDSNGEREDSYRPYDSVTAINIHNQILEIFPNAFNRLGVAELISIHQIDFINYFDTTAAVIFKGGFTPQEIKDFGIDVENFCDYCGFKYELTNQRMYIKAYDKDMWKYKLPAMPDGTKIANQFGIGRHFGCINKNLKHYRDVYFFHDDREYVMEFFGLKLDTSLTNSKCGSFGILYDERCRSVRKLKQYIYPNDLNFNNPQNI